jgi:hypothetical protein
MLAGMNSRPVFTSLVLALPLWLSACAGLQPTPSHIAVIDAGSSGSRAHLYRLSRNEDGAHVEDLAQFEDERVAALASFGPDAAQAGAQGLQPLLNRIDDYLAQHAISKTTVRIDVLATAGMRLLAAADPQAEREVYASLRETIAHDGFAAGRVATISGADEGRYAWVDVNYLRRNFEQGASTIGVIEVGGASMQIAYATGDAHRPGVDIVKVNGKSYPLLSISFLGLGQNEARKAMIAASGTAMNPCYPDNAAHAAPGVFDADTGKRGTVIVSGAYRYSDCAGLYRRVIAPFDVAANARLEGGDQVRFIGLASIYHALKEWDALEEPMRLGSRVEQACSGENAWSLKVAPMLHGKSKYAQSACANGTYIHALLFDRVNGLGLDGARLEGVNRIDGVAPAWTRGYAVLESGR